jgi:hypothetical protein
MIEFGWNLSEQMFQLGVLLLVTNAATGFIGGTIGSLFFRGYSLRTMMWGIFITLTLAVLPAVWATLYITGDWAQYVWSTVVVSVYFVMVPFGYLITTKAYFWYVSRKCHLDN